MNGFCQATSSVKWRKGWDLRFGGVATLCDKCGYISFIIIASLCLVVFLSADVQTYMRLGSLGFQVIHSHGSILHVVNDFSFFSYRHVHDLLLL